MSKLFTLYRQTPIVVTPEHHLDIYVSLTLAEILFNKWKLHFFFVLISENLRNV
jgi:hypothetical protein